MKIHRVLAIMFLVMIPTLAFGASPRPGGYFSGFIGATIPRDTAVHSTQFGTAGALDVFDDQVEFDPGLDVGGSLGYDFGFLRLEGEMSYKYAEMNAITAADGFRFGNPDGNVGVFAMMANAFVDLHTQGPVTPYLGGGVGFANISLSDTFAAEGPSLVLLYPQDDDTVFAYQAGAGVGIALNRKLSLDVGYRYFGTAKARFGQGLDPTTEFKFESHNAIVGIRVKF